MARTTKATAAPEAESPKPAAPAPKPFELVERPRPVMSADLALELEEPRLTPPNPGPRTGRPMTDMDFIAQFSTPEERARWKKEIDARRARDQASWIFIRCDRCGLTMKDRPGSPDGDPCPKCNFVRRAGAGHLRRMNDAQVAAYLSQQAAEDKAWAERSKRAAFNQRNQDRAKVGLPPLSMAQFEAVLKAEAAERRRQAKQLAEVAGLYRRKP